jgi:O-antigen/teichoic acid export membrane protein
VNGLGLKTSGILFYAERIYSTVVGFLFILLVTRNLSPEEFGAWSVLSSILTYACLATFTNYWVTRLRARGVVEATTSGLVLSLIFTLVGAGALLVLMDRIAIEFSVPASAVFIILFYVPVIYLNSTIYASLYAVSPSRAAISEFLFETGKIVVAGAFWLAGRITLNTALLAVLGGHISQFLYLFASMRRDFSVRPRKEVVGKILSLSIFNVLTQPASLIASLDVPFISYVIGNLAVAYYTVVNPFSNLVAYSYVLARGLLPTMLQTDEERVHLRSIEESLRLVLLLGVPSLVGVLFLAPNLLYLFRPEYAVAGDVLRLASFSALIGSISGALGDALQGVERADIEGKPMREVARSRIFKVFMLGYLRLAVGFPILIGVVTAIRDPLGAALFARGAWLMGDIAVLIVLAIWTRKLVDYRKMGAIVLKYLAGSLPAAIVAWLINPLKIREALLAVILAGAIYFAIVYLLDSWFRRHVAMLFSRLKKG